MHMLNTCTKEYHKYFIIKNIAMNDSVNYFMLQSSPLFQERKPILK